MTALDRLWAKSPSAGTRPQRWWRRVRLGPLAVVVAAGLATGGAAAVARHPEVSYWSTVNVIFLAPYSPINPNSLQAGTDSLITTAGIVARIVTDSDGKAQVVSDQVSLAGQGIEHGYSVRLPNDGGQWAINYDRPELVVQAIASTPAEVGRMLRDIASRIAKTLAEIQKTMHVNSFNIIRTNLNPVHPPIYVAEGSSKRATAATVVLGLGLTVAAARGMAGFRRRRRRVR